MLRQTILVKLKSGENDLRRHTKMTVEHHRTRNKKGFQKEVLSTEEKVRLRKTRVWKQELEGWFQELMR